MRDVCGRGAKGARQLLEASRKSASLLGVAGINSLFGRWLDPDVFRQQEGPNFSRNRCFDFATTFQAFLWQILQGQASCSEAVRQVQAARLAANQTVPDSGNGAYCHARTLLPMDRQREVGKGVEDRMQRLTREQDRWLGREVKILDGTSICMDDTLKNSEIYSYPSGQKAGCGFPILYMSVLFSLCNGAWLADETSATKKHDLALCLNEIMDQIFEGDVILADRAYCAYWFLALLKQRGSDVVMRLHQARRIDFPNTKKLGKNDWLSSWKKPPRKKNCPLSKEQYDLLPAEISVRITRRQVAARGQRTKEIFLASTLLDPREITADNLFDLYQRRWQIELNFRDIKSTLAMDHVRCKTPEMVERSILMFRCAYNTIRTLMFEAAISSNLSIWKLSFKGTANALNQWFTIIRGKMSKARKMNLWEMLLELVAEDIVPHRPNRSEPRAVKKRPKNYARLTSQRRNYKEIPHRNRHVAAAV